ncbi:hypothetical protein AAM29_12215 [Salmonella enterica subsp. enterica]|nr:hypothetical protein [Salmonella enterica subsp. enterica]
MYPAKLRIILNFAFRATGALATFFHPSHLLAVSSRGCKNLPPACNTKFIVQFSIECQQLLVSVAYLWYKAPDFRSIRRLHTMDGSDKSHFV